MDLKQVASQLSKKFASYKDQHKQAAKLLNDVRSTISALEAEEAKIRTAPVTREDFVEAVCAFVTKSAELGRENLQRVISGRLGDRHSEHMTRGSVVPSHFAWAHVQDVLAGRSDFAGASFALVAATNPRDWNSSGGNFDATSMCTMFEEPIKAGLKANFEKIDWPFPDALPTAVRVKRLAEISAELDGLRDSERGLVELLRATLIT